MAVDTNDRAADEGLRLQLVVLRCQAGDERAFAQLMRAFGPGTLRYLRAVVGEGAEDVQQELWLSVYRGIAALARPGAFRAWLFRATRHRAIDHLRRRRRELRLLDDTPADSVERADPATDPRAEEPTLSDAMLAAIDALAPAYREVLLLRYCDDLTYDEIALVVGSAVGTVRSRLHYAKRRLHEIVDAARPDHPSTRAEP
jgi:RNA polymerase sigma-70 factor (ECF subfamily)